MAALMERPDVQARTSAEIYANTHVFARGTARPDGSFERTLGVNWVPDTAELEAADSVDEPPRQSVDVIEPRLITLLETGDPDERYELGLTTTVNGAGALVGVRYQQALSMIAGEVETRRDLAQVRERVLDEWQDSNRERLAGLTAFLQGIDARNIDVNPFSGTIRANVVGRAIPVLAQHPDVQRVALEFDSADEDISGHSIPNIIGPVDGTEVADYIQSKPFYNRGFYGDANETVVVTEGAAADMRNMHVVFDNGSGGDRAFVCGGTSPWICSWTNSNQSATGGGGHATKVASILGGDLTLGQDANVTGSVARVNRSGVARRSKIMAIDRSPASRVETILGARSDVFLLNQSASDNSEDLTCQGNDTRSQDWNALYEAGYSLINSAGNDTNIDTTDCTMGSPASAVGVLPVASIRIEDFWDGATEDVHSESSRGGTATEGGGRTIMGLAQLTGHNRRARGLAGADYESGTNRFGTTSSSAPAVAGGAALFRQWFIPTYGSLIDDPGIMYANLLLQGDGLESISGSVSSYQRTGFNNLYGAGRFRLRAFDGPGMDQPAGWETGSWCIADGSSQYLDLYFGNPMPSDVDYIKGVAWWYDHDHDDPNIGGHDTYDMSLQRRLPGGNWQVVDNDNGDDSRKRIFHEGSDLSAGGNYWRIRLRGDTVTSDNEGCGTNSNRVYYAFYWEDNDRDEGGDIDTYVRPEAGGN